MPFQICGDLVNVRVAEVKPSGCLATLQRVWLPGKGQRKETPRKLRVASYSVMRCGWVERIYETIGQISLN